MWDSSERAESSAWLVKPQKAHSLGIIGERVASDGHVAAECDLLACFAVFDGAPGAIGGGNWKGIFGEAEDVDLEIGESVLEDGLDEGLEGCELHDRHSSEIFHEKWIQSLS